MPGSGNSSGSPGFSSALPVLPETPAFDNDPNSPDTDPHTLYRDAAADLRIPMPSRHALPGWNAGLWHPAGRGLSLLSVHKENGGSHWALFPTPWRVEPDSNRLPPAVLRVCFRKHLPPILNNVPDSDTFPSAPRLTSSASLRTSAHAGVAIRSLPETIFLDAALPPHHLREGLLN